MRISAVDSSGPRAVLSAFMRPSSLPELNSPNRALWSASRRYMKKPQIANSTWGFIAIHYLLWRAVLDPRLLPLDGVGSAVPSFQLHPVFGIDTERVPPNDAMSRFVGFGDKSWDNLKNFFQTQGFEFLFLSQSARRVAFGGSMAPKTPVLKLNRPFACKPPAAIASELTRAACAPFAKPQVAGLRHS